MAFFTSAYKLLAHLTPNWDTQLRADMQSLEDGLLEVGCAIGFGGTGTSLGSGGSGTGFVSRKGQVMTYFGQLLFGTSASWGSGNPVISGFNVGGNVNTTLCAGEGRFFRSASSSFIPILLAPASGSTFAILVVGNGTTSNPVALSAPVSGESLTFCVRAVLA